MGLLYGADRTIASASMLVLLGGAAFVLWCWRDGATARSVERTLFGALVVLFVATALNIVLQGAHDTGLHVGDAFTSSVIRDTLHTRAGKAFAARLVLLLLAVPLLFWMRHPLLPPGFRPIASIVGLGVATTAGMAGTASAGVDQPYALIAGVVHVAAASAWLGGLLFLVAFVLPQGSSEIVKVVVRRYARIEFFAVVALVATGVFEGYRRLGSTHALTSTHYGKLLLAKSAIVLVMLLIAGFSRRVTQAKWIADTAPRIRRFVALEVTLATGVVVVTVLLRFAT